MTTKEEVLGKKCSEHGTFLHLDDDNGNNVIDGDATPVLEAMDDWAKTVLSYVIKGKWDFSVDEETEESINEIYEEIVNDLKQQNNV